MDEEIESKLEQYSKGSKRNINLKRGSVNKNSEQTITIAKEKKEKVSFEELLLLSIFAVPANINLALIFFSFIIRSIPACNKRKEASLALF